MSAPHPATGHPRVRGRATGSVPFDEAPHARMPALAGLVCAPAAVRAARTVARGAVGAIELAADRGCIVWSVEIERSAAALPLVVLVDAGTGRVLRVEDPDAAG